MQKIYHLVISASGRPVSAHSTRQNARRIAEHLNDHGRDPAYKAVRCVRIQDDVLPNDDPDTSDAVPVAV